MGAIKPTQAYLITTPHKKVVYQSARDALGVFETTSGEYKVKASTLRVPVTPGNITFLLGMLENTGSLTFVQEGFSLERIDYYESLGAR